MSKQVVYLTQEEPFFSENYLKVRSLENRILSDFQVQQLPDISKEHTLYNEWQLRKKSANRFLRYFAKKTTTQTVLDLGCGNGWFTHKIAEISESNTVFGLDINPLELEQATRVFNKENLTFYYGNLFEIKEEFQEKFTLITLNACVQYFEDFEKLIQQLETLLKPKGEIHIIDSPFYKPSEIEAAKQRTKVYYQKMGVPQMSDYYFHHSAALLKEFKVLYKPKNSIVSKMFQKKDSPFIWLRYVKNFKSAYARASRFEQ